MEIFGESAKRLLVSSTKSITGHCLAGRGVWRPEYGGGASGSDYSTHDQPSGSRLGLRFFLVKDDKVPATMEYAMTNSFGFGGTNRRLLFRRYR